MEYLGEAGEIELGERPAAGMLVLQLTTLRVMVNNKTMRYRYDEMDSCCSGIAIY